MTDESNEFISTHFATHQFISNKGMTHKSNYSAFGWKPQNIISLFFYEAQHKPLRMLPHQ